MNKKDAINLFFSKFIGDSDKSLSTTFSTITTIREIEKGQILFTQGDKGEFVWFLIDGSIKLFKSNSDGKECVVRFVAPNDIFAEILFSDAQNYPVSAIAVKKSKLLGINTNGFFKLIKESGEFSSHYIAAITKRLRYFVNMIENLTTTDVQSRFLSYLNHAVNEQNSNRIELSVPKKDIALLLGTTPENFSRTLKKLANDGIIKVEGMVITLLDHTV